MMKNRGRIIPYYRPATKIYLFNPASRTFDTLSPVAGKSFIIGAEEESQMKMVTASCICVIKPDEASLCFFFSTLPPFAEESLFILRADCKSFHDSNGRVSCWNYIIGRLINISMFKGGSIEFYTHRTYVRFSKC